MNKKWPIIEYLKSNEVKCHQMSLRYVRKHVFFLFHLSKPLGILWKWNGDFLPRLIRCLLFFFTNNQENKLGFWHVANKSLIDLITTGTKCFIVSNHSFPYSYKLQNRRCIKTKQRRKRKRQKERKRKTGIGILEKRAPLIYFTAGYCNFHADSK